VTRPAGGALRRIVAVLALGVVALFVGVPAAVADGNYPIHKPPTTSVGGTGFTHPGKHKFCVSGYAPGSTVKIHRGGVHGPVVGTIHTDANGHGCTNVPLSAGCHNYTATGKDAAGVSRHSTVRVCVQGEHFNHGTTSGDPRGSDLPFTGGEIVGLVALAAALIIIGSATVVSARRRREDANAA
jgi:hypothetical protein